MRNHFGAVFKRRKFKHAYRAVPNNGASGFELRGQLGRCLRPDVQNQIVVCDFGSFFNRRYGVGGKCFGAHHVGRNWHFCTACFHRGHHGFGLRQQIRFSQTFANLQTSGQHEGVGDTATDNQLVNFVSQGLENGELGTYLAARDDGGQWTLRMRQRFLNRVDLGRQQRSRARYGRKLRNAVGRALGAMGRSKSVVDKNIAQRCQFVR